MVARPAILVGVLFHHARSLMLKTNATPGSAPDALQAWFPLLDKTAVVRPFWKGELLSMAQNELYGSCGRLACPSGTTYRLPIDLVLYYAGFSEDRLDDGQAAGDVLESMARRLASGSCFNAVRVAYSKLSSDVTWPTGPCKQFMRMVGTKPESFWGYRAVFQMELDVLPVRDGWLLSLIPLLARAASGQAWVIGGRYTPSCMVNKISGTTLVQEVSGSLATHINGNAVYSSDPTFTRWAYGHEHYCSKNGHYDAWLYTNAQDQQYSHMWSAAPEIANCKPTADKREFFQTLAVDELALRLPSAVVVHSTVQPTGTCP